MFHSSALLLEHLIRADEPNVTVITLLVKVSLHCQTLFIQNYSLHCFHRSKYFIFSRITHHSSTKSSSPSAFTLLLICHPCRSSASFSSARFAFLMSSVYRLGLPRLSGVCCQVKTKATQYQSHPWQNLGLWRQRFVWNFRQRSVATRFTRPLKCCR